VIISIALSFLLGFPAIVFYGPTKVSPIGFNVNGTSCKYEDGYVGSNGLAIYNAVFMLTSVSGIRSGIKEIIQTIVIVMNIKEKR
jgi:hypothetical protein